ncbi:MULTISPECIES: flagellar biosynthesis protein FlhA [unclassified Thalassolituus]|uniref:flagellar biosynthesis protein FlhA n=1 Tax=unclassified Thalassolituus TaxID=2624967 RepID=UPI000C540A9E|nr:MULTISPECIES: flagellar biosynthesis protein FlhA [unclassified Thalassolituus]MAS24131.1 flagellar biosynthesis protein FlhA [Oceanospirillaceae bacterium]MBL33716.1 flagellar biosynthesis protein FlhA [Oceanospirillaceae bacterium]|tara:strand:+ start:1534 stop:3735 length:2202 start_codon:yes stop_codon:yes gene_type:complete
MATATKDQILGSLRSGAGMLAQGNLSIPVMLLVLLGMMTLPLPPFLLDTFFTFNIALSIVVLLVSVYAKRPLDFAIFPTILLVATLLRLALNVASTRVVLMYGHEGGDAAGRVIEAFGEVLIGGNYAVGLVVFMILMIINFVVVTKGAGRVSEVSARFTLDAMPGKQMAIDADLNAGLIDADQAKTRRADIAAEADFYGAMDGASKFVKGDAVAGILILIINVVGGFGIGMAQHGLSFSDAVSAYTLLAIGDGLVAQIPSLLLSTATAIMVTRNGNDEDMGQQVVGQMFSSSRALAVSAGLMALMGSVPGMPHTVFIGAALVAGVIAYYISWKKEGGKLGDSIARKIGVATKTADALPSPAGGNALAAPKEKAEAAIKQMEVKELGWDDVEPVDRVGLEVGYRLIPLVDKNQGGQLLNRIKGVRRKLSQELGFLMPSVHIRDNLDLLPNQYRITLMGVTLAEAEIFPEREMAINPGQVFGKIDGQPTRDPAFGLDAFWIDADKKDRAQTLGYTVVDASTVVATHLNQKLQRHAHELLGHEDVQKLVDMLAKASPKLAEELVPNTINISQLLGVLQNLLREHVPIRDMRSIAESLANFTGQSQDIAAMTTVARLSLSRMIVQNIFGNEDQLVVMTLDPSLEQLLLKSLQQTSQQGLQSGLVLEPAMADTLHRSLGEAVQAQEAAGRPAVLLVTTQLRPAMAQFVRNSMDQLHVLAYQEIPDNKSITIVASIGGK